MALMLKSDTFLGDLPFGAASFGVPFLGDFKPPFLPEEPPLGEPSKDSFLARLPNF
jgi:hypothetical protein